MRGRAAIACAVLLMVGCRGERTYRLVCNGQEERIKGSWYSNPDLGCIGIHRHEFDNRPVLRCGCSSVEEIR